jgi:hypothetical protein
MIHEVISLIRYIHKSALCGTMPAERLNDSPVSNRQLAFAIRLSRGH